MQDVEAVLRFLTMSSNWRDFSGSYRESMDTYMGDNKDKGEKFVSSRKNDFSLAIDACEKIWGRRAFKRFDVSASPSDWRDQMLMGMYDAQMVACNEVDKSVIEKCTDQNQDVIDATKQLFIQDEEFEMSVRRATNTPSRVAYRINKIIDIMNGV